ncbi:MAG TPA: winged helix-turn-helix domain-containing protein [Nitrososphaerales archaeon]|nr:winged helix-turn-helix domain-containing protein [Nitrososphaerales archaeon]
MQSSTTSSFADQTETIETGVPVSRDGRTHRDRMTVIASILELSLNGSLKTHIMYKVNLSFFKLRRFLEILLQNGLVRESMDHESSKVVYYTTESGRAWLEKFKVLEQLTNFKGNF